MRPSLPSRVQNARQNNSVGRQHPSSQWLRVCGSRLRTMVHFFQQWGRGGPERRTLFLMGKLRVKPLFRLILFQLSRTVRVCDREIVFSIVLCSITKATMHPTWWRWKYPTGTISLIALFLGASCFYRYSTGTGSLPGTVRYNMPRLGLAYGSRLGIFVSYWHRSVEDCGASLTREV
jgi:hypothetical protein